MSQELISYSYNTVKFGNTTLKDENEILRNRIAALESEKSEHKDEIKSLIVSNIKRGRNARRKKFWCSK